MSESFDYETPFENALVKLLQRDFGWGEFPFLRHPTERELIANWAQILFENNREIDRLGDWPLTESEMGQILDQIKTLRTPCALNGFINGKTVSITRDNPNDTAHLGHEVSLKIYDRREIAAGKSRYQIAVQPEFATHEMTHDRRGDLMLLINGMPVIHIELKRTGVPVSQAAWQIQKYAHEGVFTGIFSLVQVFVAMNPDETLYFANPGPDGAFNPDFFFHWGDFNNEPVNDYKLIARDLLSIPAAHELIGFYTVADSSDGLLKVMRSYQIYAARAVTNKVSQTKWADRTVRGGYVWHTTGSGKTLTSFKCAQLISESDHADKVVFLLNRIELGTQTLLNFQGFADDATDVQGTENTHVLVSKLKSDAGADKLIVTSIQKMSRIKGESANARDLELIRRKRLVFIVDECHSDTFGDMLATIKATFPAGLFFGFTGTPIERENERNGNTTKDVFGDELHRYSIADGIRDKNVLGFDPSMMLTYPDNEVREKVALEKARAGSVEEALADETKRRVFLDWMQVRMMIEVEGELPDSQYDRDPYREKVVEDIVAHWATRSVLGKFHAILATSSIPEAFAYYRLLKTRKPDLKTTVLVDDSIDNTNGATAKEDALIEVLTDYNARYGKHYTLPTYGDFKKDVSLRLAHKEPYRGIETRQNEQIDLIIVVNQMLTGYDSKWVNTLYLDKMLEYARVVQAFSRTNRLFGSDKPFGNIFYYRRPHTMANNVKDALALYSGNRPLGVFVSKLKEHLERLNLQFDAIAEVFRNAGVSDFATLPSGDDEKARFARLFNEFNALLNAAKVQGFVWTKHDYSDVMNGQPWSIAMHFDERDYAALVQRYKELTTGAGGGGGESSSVPPFDINPILIQVNTGHIDADYMNGRFRKFLVALQDGGDVSTAEVELHRSFAMLSQEDQKFALQFLDDVKNGRIAPDPAKSLRDYITEYRTKAKDDQIHRFAVAFGLNEAKLREIMAAQVTAATINAYNRFSDLRASVNPFVAAAYFSQLDGRTVSTFQANRRIDEILRRFILTGGFDVGVTNASAVPIRADSPDEGDYEDRMAAFEDRDA